MRGKRNCSKGRNLLTPHTKDRSSLRIKTNGEENVEVIVIPQQTVASQRGHPSGSGRAPLWWCRGGHWEANVAFKKTKKSQLVYSQSSMNSNVKIHLFVDFHGDVGTECKEISKLSVHFDQFLTQWQRFGGGNTFIKGVLQWHLPKTTSLVSPCVSKYGCWGIVGFS